MMKEKHVSSIHKKLNYGMSYNDYLGLEIAQHTALSDAQYLKLNLS